MAAVVATDASKAALGGRVANAQRNGIDNASFRAATGARRSVASAST
jgi:tRNA/tmRNA/rRNA uracil-C5-methylase (TrmA/RlmC/RlmD family)